MEPLPYLRGELPSHCIGVLALGGSAGLGLGLGLGLGV